MRLHLTAIIPANADRGRYLRSVTFSAPPPLCGQRSAALGQKESRARNEGALHTQQKDRARQAETGASSFTVLTKTAA
jgi:hypothetical protein